MLAQEGFRITEHSFRATNRLERLTKKNSFRTMKLKSVKCMSLLRNASANIDRHDMYTHIGHFQTWETESDTHALAIEPTVDSGPKGRSSGGIK